MSVTPARVIHRISPSTSAGWIIEPSSFSRIECGADQSMACGCVSGFSPMLWNLWKGLAMISPDAANLMPRHSRWIGCAKVSGPAKV